MPAQNPSNSFASGRNQRLRGLPCKPNKAIVFALSAAALTGCVGAKFGDLQRSREGMAAASPVVTALEDFRQAEGRYPHDLQELALAPEARVIAGKVGLAYFAQPDGASYGMAFGFPYAGMLYVSCTQRRGPAGLGGTWRCTGK